MLVSDDSQLSLAAPDTSVDAADETAELDVSTQDTPYNEKANVNVSLKTNATMPKVNIFVDGNSVKNLTLFMKGSGSYSIPAKTYDVGSHTVEVKCGNITKSVILNITPVSTVITTQDVTVNVGDIVTVPFTVTDNKGKGIAGKARVTIFLDEGNVSQIVEFDDTNKFNFDFSELLDFTNLFNGTSMNMSGKFSGSDFNISSMFNGTNFNISGLFNGTTFNFTGNFNFSSLMNGTGFNITGLNLTGLLNGSSFNMSALFNGSSIDISGLLNGTGFNLTGLLNGTGLDIGGLFNGTDYKSFFNGTDFSNNFNITNFDFGKFTSKSGDTASTSRPGSSDDLLGIDMGSLTNGTFPGMGNGTFPGNWTIPGFGNGTFDIASLLEKFGINLTKIFGGNVKQHNATFDYPFEPGVYKMLVELLGDGNYLPSFDTAKLTVLGNSTDDDNNDSGSVPEAAAKSLPAAGNPLAMAALSVLTVCGLGLRRKY